MRLRHKKSSLSESLWMRRRQRPSSSQRSRSRRSRRPSHLMMMWRVCSSSMTKKTKKSRTFSRNKRRFKDQIVVVVLSKRGIPQVISTRLKVKITTKYFQLMPLTRSRKIRLRRRINNLNLRPPHPRQRSQRKLSSQLNRSPLLYFRRMTKLPRNRFSKQYGKEIILRMWRRWNSNKKRRRLMKKQRDYRMRLKHLLKRVRNWKIVSN